MEQGVVIKLTRRPFTPELDSSPRSSISLVSQVDVQLGAMDEYPKQVTFKTHGTLK